MILHIREHFKPIGGSFPIWKQVNMAERIANRIASRIANRIKDRIKVKPGKVFRGTYLIPPFRSSAKGEENMQRRKLENLNLLDDFLFGTMVTYPGIGEAFVRELL